MPHSLPYSDVHPESQAAFSQSRVGSSKRPLAGKFGVVIALAALALSATPARANDVVARVLQSRNWWIDFGSSGSGPFGRLYNFGTQTKPDAEGWYRGTVTTFSGEWSVPRGSSQGRIDWKPTASGVIIGRWPVSETSQFVKWLPYPDEALILNGSFNGVRVNYILTTRSRYCPESIRRAYWH